MKKVVLLALLALALPTVALADTFDYGNVGGTVTGSNSTGWTITSTLTSIQDVTTNTLTTGNNLGTVVFTTGAVTNGAFSTGSITITATGGSVLFSGTFSSGTISTVNGVTFIDANLACSGCGSVQIVASGAISGDTIVTPEPGTLGLLGTGLVGLAGIVRRKLRG